jgi:hypothetical protein
MIDIFLPLGIALLIIGVLSLPSFICYRILMDRIEMLETKVYILTEAQVRDKTKEGNK